MRLILVLILLTFAAPSYAAHYHHRHQYHTQHKTLKFKRIRRLPLTNISCLTPATRAAFGELQAIFGPLRVVSTCRPGATIRGTNRPSQHRYGKAIDFTVPRGKKSAVVRWLMKNFSGGIMTYCNHSHIHMDTGPHFIKLGARG